MDVGNRRNGEGLMAGQLLPGCSWHIPRMPCTKSGLLITTLMRVGKNLGSLWIYGIVLQESHGMVDPYYSDQETHIFPPEILMETDTD